MAKIQNMYIVNLIGLTRVKRWVKALVSSSEQNEKWQVNSLKADFQNAEECVVTGDNMLWVVKIRTNDRHAKDVPSQSESTTHQVAGKPQNKV